MPGPRRLCQRPQLSRSVPGFTGACMNGLRRSVSYAASREDQSSRQVSTINTSCSSCAKRNNPICKDARTVSNTGEDELNECFHVDWARRDRTIFRDSTCEEGEDQSNESRPTRTRRRRTGCFGDAYLSYATTLALLVTVLLGGASWTSALRECFFFLSVATFTPVA
jgi:hypothetical protein